MTMNPFGRSQELGPKLFEPDAQGITGKLAFDACGEMTAPVMGFLQRWAGMKLPLK